MLGFFTWAMLAFHLTSRHLLSSSLVAVLYALAMAVATVAKRQFLLAPFGQYGIETSSAGYRYQRSKPNVVA